MADPNKWLALMKWSMKYNDGTAPSQFRELSQDDREFLERVMKEAVIDENERVKSILRIIDGEHPSIVYAKDGQAAEEEPIPEEDLEDYKQALLDELLTRVDQIDMAMNFCKNGGLVVMIKTMRTHARPETRAMAAEVCSVVVQNNPFSQNAAVDAGVVEVLCELANHEATTCQVKALLAISCLVRHHSAAEARFLSEQCAGLSVLQSFLQSNRDIRLQRKSVFFLRYLVRNSTQTAQRVLDAGFYVPALAKFIAHEDLDLCEGSLEALIEFAHVGDAAFLRAVQHPDHGVKNQLTARIQQITLMEGEEREYANEIMNLATQLLEIVSPMD